MGGLQGFIFGFLCFFPKERLVLFSSGAFNVGMIDAVIFLWGLVMFGQSRVLTFAETYDKRVLCAFIGCALATMAVASEPAASWKSLMKVFEALVVYLYILNSQEFSSEAFFSGMFFGAIGSLFFLNWAHSDSKIYSAAMSLAAFFFVLEYLRLKERGEAASPKLWLYSASFLMMSMLLYPKKGSLIALALVGLLLGWFKYYRISLRAIATVAITGVPAYWILKGKQNLTAQIADIVSFASGSINMDSLSLYVRGLQWLVIPSLLVDLHLRGYGFSQSQTGIDNNLFIHFYNLSMSLAGFAPPSSVMRVGGNFFSDNVYFTLSAEMGILILIPGAVLVWNLVHYYRTYPLLFCYCVYILIFSCSTIDIFIYRGSGIFFLNPALFALLLRAPALRTETENSAGMTPPSRSKVWKTQHEYHAA